ncbi:MAG: tetratricopeptide repeat-containing glycosyltransferase, partial [Desulfofundulus sp.]
KSDWILSLDADEELDTSPGDLRSLINNNSGYEAFFLPLHNRTNENPHDYSRFFVLRLFRNKACYRFQGVIHEQVVISRPEAVGTAQGPVIWHRPLPKRERNRKRGRNLALLRRAVAADPANPFLQYYLGVEWLGLGKAGRALPCFERAYKCLEEGHILFRAPAVRYLIACLKALGRLDEAICICLEETHRYPFYTDLFFDGGLLFEEKGEYEIAIRWFKEALKCGPPPVLFAHTSGTESFLSLYHLGYCHEKLDRVAQAKDYYEQALVSNPAYIYPLYNLFLVYLSEQGPGGAFDYCRAAGHLKHPQRAAVLADLFYEAGFADLACACLEEAGKEQDFPTGTRARRLARFYTYAGRVDRALSLINHIRDEDIKTDFDLAVDEVVALVLKNDFSMARKRALSLWRKPEERGAAWALFNLIALSAGKAVCGLPEKSREPQVVKTLLAVVENCLRSCHGTGFAPGYQRLATQAMRFLVELSPRSCNALITYLQEKACTVRRMLDCRFGPARGLFP